MLIRDYRSGRRITLAGWKWKLTMGLKIKLCELSGKHRMEFQGNITDEFGMFWGVSKCPSCGFNVWSEPKAQKGHG